MSGTDEVSLEEQLFGKENRNANLQGDAEDEDDGDEDEHLEEDDEDEDDEVHVTHGMPPAKRLRKVEPTPEADLKEKKCFLAQFDERFFKKPHLVLLSRHAPLQLAHEVVECGQGQAQSCMPCR